MNRLGYIKNLEGKRQRAEERLVLNKYKNKKDYSARKQVADDVVIISKSEKEIQIQSSYEQHENTAELDNDRS